MVQTVKLGQRYWLVKEVPDMSSPRQRLVTELFQVIEKAYHEDDTERLYEAAGTLVKHAVVEEVETDSVDNLNTREIGELVNAVSEEYDAGVLRM